jgi:hypothetical protein
MCIFYLFITYITHIKFVQIIAYKAPSASWTLYERMFQINSFIFIRAKMETRPVAEQAQAFADMHAMTAANIRYIAS